jgi:Ca2+-dependent lipid-binding protein
MPSQDKIFKPTLYYIHCIGFALHRRTLDVMAFPLVRLLSKLVTRVVSQLLLVFPHSYQVELVPGAAGPQGPVGMLTVRIVKVAGLRSEDLIGHSDPYCVVQVRGRGADRGVVREGEGVRGSRGTNHLFTSLLEKK